MTYTIVFESNTIDFNTKPFALDFDIVYDHFVAVYHSYFRMPGKGTMFASWLQKQIGLETRN